MFVDFGLTFPPSFPAPSNTVPCSTCQIHHVKAPFSRKYATTASAVQCLVRSQPSVQSK